MKRFSILIFSLFTLIAFNGCKEDIDESNLYTFTGETIEDYLVNRNDRFSSFNYILSRIGYDKILAAYGTYTCFAPDNDAVAAYIDSLYDDTSNKDFQHNGMTARGLEGLTDSLCEDIALFHLLNTQVMSVNMGNGMTIKTMLGRDITTSLDSVSTCVVINRDAQIPTSGMDNELENGILHEINHVITRSNNLIAGEMEAHPEMGIFMNALKLTGIADSLTALNKKVQQPADRHGFYVPDVIQMGYTIFAETDEVLQANNINDINDLIEYANNAYGKCALEKDPDTKEGWYDYFRNNGIEVSTGSDYQNFNNALNMFVRYHILKCKVPVNKLTNSHNEVSKVQKYEYYETMLPYTLLKVTLNNGRRYINRWQYNNSLTNLVAELGTNDMHAVAFAGIEIGNQNEQISALNGYIHPIKDMLTYNWDVPNGTLNERLRFDAAALFGEMMSSSYRMISYDEVKALNGGKSGSHGELSGDYIRFPEGSFNDLVIYNGESTCLYYLPGQGSGWSNYQGDEFNCMGAYDFAMRLPPIPDGTYELRIGYTAETKRGMIQFYLGSTSKLSSMKAIDIPLDMRIIPDNNANGTPDARTGWCDWNKTEDRGIESDANMRNLNYMRGPLAYTVGVGGSPARSNVKDLRRIITKQQFHQEEIWMRFKTVLPKLTTTEFHLDYIEFCPENVYNNTQYVEDMY
jgi:uncharacterized surface protein with fasciclin (FAS1) repeats